MNQISFFQWIRESVRRSVLLGFSDAVEQLGAPTGNQELHPQLTALLQTSATKELPAPTALANKPARKRLGRSLNLPEDGGRSS